MTAALIMGLMGLTSSIWIGMENLDFTILEILYCILISNLAVLVALPLTLQAEKTAWMEKIWQKGAGKSWLTLTTLYFGILLVFASPLRRDFSHFLSMAFPLMLSTGFSLFLFGPLQDFLVRRHQRRLTGQDRLPIS